MREKREIRYVVKVKSTAKGYRLGIASLPEVMYNHVFATLL